jgi:hypothetical protein
LAIRLYERLVAENAGNYQAGLAQAWQQLADYLDDNRPGADAIQARENAVNMFRSLTGRKAPADPEAIDG